MRPSRKSIGGRSTMSAEVQTATTPGMARAAAVSMETMLPWAWLERTTRIWSWCGNEISPAKRPAPATSGGSSSRSTERPIHLLSPVVMNCSAGAAGSLTSPRWGEESPAARPRNLSTSSKSTLPRRALQRPPRDGAGKIAAVLGADDGIIERVDGGGDRLGGSFEGGTTGRPSGERLLGLRDAARGRLHAADRNHRLDHRAVPDAVCRKRHGEREVAGPAIELIEPAAGVGRRRGQAHFGEQLVLPQRRRHDATEIFARRDDAAAGRAVRDHLAFERRHHQAPFRGGIGMRHAAAEGAPGADGIMGNMLDDRRE